MEWNYTSIPKLQRLHLWSLGMDKWFHPTLYTGHNCLCTVELKLNHVSKSSSNIGYPYDINLYLKSFENPSFQNINCSCQTFWNITVTSQMSVMASQITRVSIVYSTVCSGAHQRNQKSWPLRREFPSWPVNSPHKGPVTRKMFPFDDVIMICTEPGSNTDISLPF